MIVVIFVFVVPTVILLGVTIYLALANNTLTRENNELRDRLERICK